MPQAALPILQIAIPAAIGAAGIAGSALQAKAAQKREDERFNRLHPAKTPEQIANIQGVRDRLASSMEAEPTGQNNPFATATQQGMDRLSQVRQKLAELQQANMARGGAVNYSAAPKNPFMG